MTNLDFSNRLLAWYYDNKREMPWRNTKDPYIIWVSEIMLQQTRVDQARPYFDNFLEQFPTVFELANAPRQQVLKAWEGLGYYSRARNLHDAAKTVVAKYNGIFPSNYDDVISLKGIGPYTAAAITSIAFNQPNAVVDGNVIRVITRYYGIADDTRKSGTVKQVQKHVDELIPADNPADFNQAMMELGALVCTPKNPTCEICPLQPGCIAAKLVQTDVIPYKSPAKKKPHKHIGVGIIERKDGKVLIALRPENVMLGGLWEFPGGKQEKGENIEQTVVRELKEELGVDVIPVKEFMSINHSYSHFNITLHAYKCILSAGIPEAKASSEIKWVDKSELERFPFPKANKKLTEKLMEE